MLKTQLLGAKKSDFKRIIYINHLLVGTIDKLPKNTQNYCKISTKKDYFILQTI
jgi:hypothetical protein